MEFQFLRKEWVDKTSFLPQVEVRNDFFNKMVGLCRRCTRYEFQGVVPPEGGFDAEVMIHGVAPGRVESEEKRPFSPNAPGGRMLNSYLELLGMSREKCYLTNACFCMAAGDRLPSQDESVSCMYWKTLEYMQLRNLKYVFLLGNDAVRQCLGFNYPSLSNMSGEMMDMELNGRKVQVCLLHHPGYVLRRPTIRKRVVVQLGNFRMRMETLG